MKKALPLLVSLLCLTTMACKPHPEHGDRGDRGDRREQHMERKGGGGEHRGGLRKACRADIEQYCAADQKGRDRRECLQSHMDKLSADCKTALQDRMNKRGGGRKNGDSGDKTDDN